MKEIFELIRERKFKALFYKPTDNTLLQFLRYLFAGGGATVADWSVLYILRSLLSVQLYVSVAIAFCFGLCINYVLSKLFVFNGVSKKAGRTAEISVYLVTGLIGLGFTEGLMFVFCDLLNIYYMPSKIVTTALVLAWNFGSKKFILYREREKK